MTILLNNGHPHDETEFRLAPGGYVGCTTCHGLTPEAEYVARRDRGLMQPEICDECRLRITFLLSYLHPDTLFKPRTGEPLISAIIDGRLWIGREDDARFWFGRIE